MTLVGKVISVKGRFIKVISRNNLLNLYVLPYQFNRNNTKILKNCFIHFKVSSSFSKILSIYKIWLEDVIVYSKKLIANNLFKFLKSNSYLLFIDLEKTLYHSNRQEIFQISFVLTDSNFNVIKVCNKYIKTKLPFSNLTKKFFNLDFDYITSVSVNFGTFYKFFSRICQKYKPAIITYGDNDITDLNKIIANFKLPNCITNLRHINFEYIVSYYYDLDNSLSLFNLKNKYKIDSTIKQKHDALQDSFFTLYCYKMFLNDVKNLKFHL